MEFKVTLFVLACSLFASLATGFSSIPCPPAFVDMEAFFEKTMRVNERMRDMFNEFKTVNSKIDNCKYSWDQMSNLDNFNEGRCIQDQYVDIQCTTTTKSTTTTTTTRPSTVAPTTTRTSTRSSSGPHTSGSGADRSTWPSLSSSVEPSAPTSAPPKPLPQPSTPRIITQSPSQETTSSNDVTVPALDGDSVNVGQVAAKQLENKTTIYICAGAGGLLLIIVACIILVCRSQSGASAGAHKKNHQRRRSSLERINSIQDAMSRSSVGSESSWRYSRDFGKRKKWRPNYSSENSSEHGSMRSSKFLLARENSTHSTASDFHFNSLKHLDHPNAVVLGGFGETSTDLTLKRHNGTLKNGDLTGTISHPELRDTLKSKGEQFELTLTNDMIRNSGYDNLGRSRCNSIDSSDHAIMEWKSEVLGNTMKPKQGEDELITSENDFMFAYDNKALERSTIDLNSPAPNVAVVLPNQRLSVKEMRKQFENSNIAQNTLPHKGTNGVINLSQANEMANKFNTLPNMTEKPSAHVHPQQQFLNERDADVQL